MFKWPHYKNDGDKKISCQVKLNGSKQKLSVHALKPHYKFDYNDISMIFIQKG